MTGRDLISASLRLIGALAPGESLAASEATDGLASFNRMIDSWSTESLLIYARVRESFSLVAGTAAYTMGSGATFSTTRPQVIESVTISRSSVETPPLNLLSLAQWAAIPDKTTQSTPDSVYASGSYPNETLNFYPTPDAADSVIIYSQKVLTAITLDAAISLPPGYERALVYNGALELAPEYGKQIDAMVLKAAEESKNSIKRANYRPNYLEILDVPAGSRGRFDINTGGYR